MKLLVESFKSTFEEVQDADVVLHVRDISHPHTEDQKKAVLDVLKEISPDETFYSKRMVLAAHYHRLIAM